jgi:nucleotide-binding universal stress UspA family protein
MRHDELILASEQAAFFDHTRLDRLRPEAELETSLPGQYDKLENHIEVHRFFIEMKEARALVDEEAVGRWYDEAYLPVVEAIREQGLLRGFNKRTETDLYLWIADNQAALRNELGWEIDPQTAVENFPLPPETTQQNRLGRFYNRVLKAVVPKKGEAQQSWSAHKTLDRYSDRLFAAILAITTAGDIDTAVAQAVTIAQKEEAFLFVIQTKAGGDEGGEAGEMSSARAAFDLALVKAGVSAEFGFEQADLSQIIQRRLYLVDLLVLTTAILSTDQARGGNTAILNKCARPVLLVPAAPRAVARILLVYDDSPEAREALFAAAYMAELWGCQVVLLAKPDAAPGALNKAAPYLEMHETAPESILAGPLAPEPVFQTAAEQQCDLVVVGGYREGPMSKTAVASWLIDAPENLKCLLFVCP